MCITHQGKNMPDLDLVLQINSSTETYWAQIKAQAKNRHAVKHTWDQMALWKVFWENPEMPDIIFTYMDTIKYKDATETYVDVCDLMLN